MSYKIIRSRHHSTAIQCKRERNDKHIDEFYIFIILQKFTAKTKTKETKTNHTAWKPSLKTTHND